METPFGPIRMLVDGEVISCTAAVHSFDHPLVRERPLAGCYRVRVSGGEGQEISCVLKGAADGLGSSGEGYQAAEFFRGNRVLTIGAETDREDRLVRAESDGITLRLLGDGEVVFGIAWVEDYAGSGDVRTWFAADPTLDS